MIDTDEPRKPRNGWRTFVIVVLAALVVLMAGFYFVVLPGFSIARQEPSGMEVAVATFMLKHSVPAADAAKVNPLNAQPDAANIRAGETLYVTKCAMCHAHDGGGRTELGGATFPRPPVLRVLAPQLSDGEIFYHIRNGIRNTAMPAWNLPDRQIWQLVSYIRHLPLTAGTKPEELVAQQTQAVKGAQYVGSKACQSCHQEVYARWTKTAMANVVRDPKIHPDAFAADPATAPDEQKFSKDDVAFVYGSRWKQRYFKKAGDTYTPLPVQFNIATKKWSKYHVADGTDWWTVHYPDPAGDNSARPTAPLCDGCHSVDFNIDTKKPVEWNVGCERCHGPGSAHVANPIAATILNPARQDFVQANDTCIQCHSQGQPLSNPIKGQYYDWPVGYHAGLLLSDFWKLEPHKLGETTFTHFPDGTAHKNRMQGNDYVQSLMYNRGVTCFSCHDPHGTENDAMLRKPATEICSSCHSPNNQNGPHTASIEEHTHHAAGSPGSQCVACHMPKVLPQLPGGPFVSTHTFHFVSPEQTEAMQIPNACNACHKDKDTAWAGKQLASWKTVSGWRMQTAVGEAEAPGAAKPAAQPAAAAPR
jgi:predicted CXXCH cytochrome family protein